MATNEIGRFTGKRVGVIGGNSPDRACIRVAEEMGCLIAENGYLLVNGGMKGIMEASARGAHSSGGVVIGILPGRETTEANEFTDIPIPTGLGYMRNALVVLNSDILVAINGEYGTLSEIAYAQIFHKPVLGIDTWDIRGLIQVSNPREAIQRIKDYFDGQL